MLQTARVLVPLIGVAPSSLGAWTFSCSSGAEVRHFNHTNHAGACVARGGADAGWLGLLLFVISVIWRRLSKTMVANRQVMRSGSPGRFPVV